MPVTSGLATVFLAGFLASITVAMAVCFAFFKLALAGVL